MIMLDPIFYDLHRWTSIRTDALAGLFTSSQAFYLVYGRGPNMSSANMGLSVAMAVSFSSMILVWVRIFDAVELHENKLRKNSPLLQHGTRAQIFCNRYPSGVLAKQWESTCREFVRNVYA